jgi:predicted nucleic acid-binding protein
MPPNSFDKVIISDTSCLIALTNTGNLDILRKARSFAQDLGLAITGTLGILIAAFRQGIIADLDPVIAGLKACDFRLPRDLPAILSRL